MGELRPKVLYHGICTEFVDEIKELGLIPPGEDREATQQADGESIGNKWSVYLTDSREIADQYAKNCVLEHGGVPVILTITVTDELFADFSPDKSHNYHYSREDAGKLFSGSEEEREMLLDWEEFAWWRSLVSDLHSVVVPHVRPGLIRFDE